MRGHTIHRWKGLTWFPGPQRLRSLVPPGERWWYPYVLALPAMVFLALFIGVPLVQGVILSFQSGSIVGTRNLGNQGWHYGR